MTILLAREKVAQKLCWRCAMPLNGDEPVILLDAVQPILLHARCALKAGKDLLADGQTAEDLNDLIN